MKEAQVHRLLSAGPSCSIARPPLVGPRAILFAVGFGIAFAILAAAGPARGQSDSSAVPAASSVIAVPPPIAAADAVGPPARAPTPRLDLSVASFAISDGGSASVPLTGLELDLYALSIPWLRAGLSASAGRGHATIDGAGVGVRYGLLGATAALQFPARFSPFVAGSVNGGVLDGSLEGALSIPGTSVAISGASGVTWMYTRGLDVGAQLYMLGSLHLTGSVGWLRATWRGVDQIAMASNPAGGLQLTSVTNDSVAFKLGIGF